ncbi:HNH endonuclease family protein [Cellulomonas sp. P22]|uniref:HNH endonuclease family protein n=1 Tax=Cellulomonas sp. P22 TaxID=3373189 RepID=UPI0037B3BA4B
MPRTTTDRTNRRAPWWLLLIVAVALGVGVPVWNEQHTGADVPVTATDLADARAKLDALPVKGRAPRTGYERSLFGEAWADVDRNGCDTRNDVLRRDLTDVTFKEGTDGCTVQTGTLVDPYGGATIAFERGERSSEVQIDHVVALSDAWQKGAQQWTTEVRTAFANDPANLMAVDGPLNQQKGAGDAATWLPPLKGFRCVYVVRQIRVKAAYGLWVTAAERDAMTRELDRCTTAPPA